MELYFNTFCVPVYLQYYVQCCYGILYIFFSVYFYFLLFIL